MTRFDTSWDALLDPGASSAYFQAGFRGPLQPRLTRFSATNALWLAELARLVYRPGPTEPGGSDTAPSRNEILRRVGWREHRFFSRDGTDAAVVMTDDAAGEPLSVLVFRGTHDVRDWLYNLQTLPVDWPGGGHVHRGFVDALDRIWDDVSRCLDELPGTVLYTGHSLGAALATLAASRRPSSVLYTFGSPRVGDRRFVGTLADMRVHRVVNNQDLVAAVPPSVGALAYTHAGEMHHLRAPAEDAPVDRRWFDPPPPLSDHAPINYVAALSAELG